MSEFLRLLWAETVKLRRSAVLRFVILLPLAFLALECWIFERPALGLRDVAPEFARTFEALPVKAAVALWGGFFHPLMLAVLPALIFRPEHQFKQWRRLHAMPTSRRTLFLSKAVLTGILLGASLGAIGLGLGVERAVMGRLNPSLALPFHGRELAKVLAWLWLGSLPVLALYLWVSDRINSLAVPIVLGLVGLLLTIALSGQELAQPWKRDLIPWVLPYFCAQGSTHPGSTRETVHIAGSPFQEEPNILRLPSGKKVRTWQSVPDEVLFPPPPPTPKWVLAGFSLAAGLALLGLGVADAGRNRV